MGEILKLWWLVILLIVIISLLSFILIKFLKKGPLVKYTPTFLIWISSVLLFTYAHFFTTSAQDLDYYVLSLATGLLTLVVLIVTILIDKHYKNKKDSETKIKDE